MNWWERIVKGQPPARQRIQKGKNAGIAEILVRADQNTPPHQNPQHAGMGILIDKRHLITCAHVVNSALCRDLRAQDEPTETVTVGWPMLGIPDTVRARVVKWRPPGPHSQDDIAVLGLASDAPEDAGFVIFADVTGMPPDGDELSIFGIGAGKRLGNHIDARFKGVASAAWAQLDGVSAMTGFIIPGFSGGAVWDHPHSAVLGMVVARKDSDQQLVAYMIPTADLRDFWPGLEVEDRPLPPTFARTWTVFSALFFFLVLAHFGVAKGLQTFSAATLSGNHKQLAAFWGMHVYAVLAPALLTMLILFARSFRLHDWVTRVPSFGGIRMRPISSATKRTAGISLAMFVVLPLFAQIHFILFFHNEGYVYVRPERFGYTSDDAVFRQDRCDKSSIHICPMNNGADRYSLATPKRGFMPGVWDGYWNDAYQYGDRQNGKGSVTFFPIFQPMALLMLTALNAALAALALYLAFKPTPEQRSRRASSASPDAVSL